MWVTIANVENITNKDNVEMNVILNLVLPMQSHSLMTVISSALVHKMRSSPRLASSPS